MPSGFLSWDHTSPSPLWPPLWPSPLWPPIVTKGVEQLTGTGRAYAGALAGVRKGFGRDIDFSKQSDREAIGNALVNHVRQTGGCDINGKKQPGC